MSPEHRFKNMNCKHIAQGDGGSTFYKNLLLETGIMVKPDAIGRPSRAQKGRVAPLFV